jgi:4'-phosphopantetheinyl transferase
MNRMQLFWLECVAGDLPGHTDWLSPEELSLFSRLRFQKRRDDWLLGRWTAKCAIAAYLKIDVVQFPQIAILPERSGAPVATIRGSPAEISLSISHRAARGFVVVVPAGFAVGADIELVEPHGRVFTEDYFTSEEKEQFRQTRELDADALTTLIWSAKESALKLLHLGLTADTRCVSIRVYGPAQPGTSWKQFSATFLDGRAYRGWWRHSGDWIFTEIGESASSPPIELLNAYRSNDPIHRIHSPL